MIRQRLVAGFVTVIALVALASCGSDKKSSSTTKPAATAAGAATTATAAGGASANGAGSTATSPDITTAATGSKGTGSNDTTADDGTIDLGDDTISIPAVPAGASAACKDLYTKFITASGGADGTAKLGDLFDGMKKIVPADLKDDVDLMSSTYQGFEDAIAKAGGNQAEALSDPEVQKAMTALSDPKVEAASNAVDAWFTKTCPDATDDTAG